MNRYSRHRRGQFLSRGSSREHREADLFWAALVGGPAPGSPSSIGRDARIQPTFARQPIESYAPVEDVEDVEDYEGAEWAEALPAGQTASPCDIAKTSETLDNFVLNKAKLIGAHTPIIKALAACLLAARGGSRPIRNVEIVGFTDTSGNVAFNQKLGQDRANAVHAALVKELNDREAGSAASFNFNPTSRGKTQQIAGSAAANRRVEVFVNIAVTDLVVHATDTDTHEIRSNLGAAGLEHFCCVKNTGEILLEAQITPNVVGDPARRLTWDASPAGTVITSPAVGTDARTARMSSATPGKFPVQVKWDGTVVRQAVVWVIFSRITITARRNITAPTFPGLRRITAGIDHSFKIEPPEIITDADRPALDGPRTAAVPGAAQTHAFTGNTLAGGAGSPLAATHKWDASRQIRIKVLNPHLYPPGQLADVNGGHLWAGQPAATTNPENFPANDTIGNDDTHDGDENNDPYANAGVVTATDDPFLEMANATGANGETFELRLHFREFLRVNLDTKWYRVSDFSLWRTHFRFRRVSGAWTNNTSVFEQNNNGF